MFKKLLLSSVLFAGIATASFDSYYVGVSPIFTKSKNFKGFGATAHVGTNINANMAIELETGYIRNKSKKLNVETDGTGTADILVTDKDGKTSKTEINEKGEAILVPVKGGDLTKIKLGTTDQYATVALKDVKTFDRVTLNQVPLLVNLVVKGQQNQFSYYAKLGLGAMFTSGHIEQTKTGSYLDFDTVTSAAAGDEKAAKDGKHFDFTQKADEKGNYKPYSNKERTKIKNKLTPAAKVAFGASYSFNEQFSIGAEFGALMTKRVKYAGSGDNKVLLSDFGVKTPSVMPYVGLTLNYNF
jgi:hypothetical protein